MHLESSVLDAELLRAYRETHYCVYGPTPFVLRIDSASPPLAALHQRMGVSCSAFITACNPYSQAIGAEENARRHAALAADLARQGWVFFEGVGQHPDNGWPAEPSFLVLGLTREAASAWGRALQQNAIVHCGVDAVPRLVVLR